MYFCFRSKFAFSSCFPFLTNMRLFLLLAFTSALTLLETYGFTYETDRQALLEFKSQVSEDTRLVLSSWNHSLPLCNWKGVSCGRKHKRVADLNLGGFQLDGVISSSIGNLSFLISLDLSNNSFVGTIPQKLGNLFRLKYLDMSSNYLGGGIPASLSNCSRLFILDLHSFRTRIITETCWFISSSKQPDWEVPCVSRKFDVVSHGT